MIIKTNNKEVEEIIRLLYGPKYLYNLMRLELKPAKRAPRTPQSRDALTATYVAPINQFKGSETPVRAHFISFQSNPMDLYSTRVHTLNGWSL